MLTDNCNWTVFRCGRISKRNLLTHSNQMWRQEVVRKCTCESLRLFLILGVFLLFKVLAEKTRFLADQNLFCWLLWRLLPGRRVGRWHAADPVIPQRASEGGEAGGAVEEVWVWVWGWGGLGGWWLGFHWRTALRRWKKSPSHAHLASSGGWYTASRRPGRLMEEQVVWIFSPAAQLQSPC